MSKLCHVFVHVTSGRGSILLEYTVIRYVFPVLWMSLYSHMAVRHRRRVIYSLLAAGSLNLQDQKMTYCTVNTTRLLVF